MKLYEVSGEGPPLIVLHGAHMNIQSMGKIIPRLAQRHRVYALELQGHGRTTISIERSPIGISPKMLPPSCRRSAWTVPIYSAIRWAPRRAQLAIRHPGRVNKLILASAPYSLAGWQPAYQAFIR